MNENLPIDLTQAASPGLIRRCISILYDSLLVFGLLLLGSIVATLPLGLLSDAETSQNLPQHPLFQIWLALIPPTFFIYFWVNGGQTLGMRSWRLRVVREDGSALRVPEAAIRFLAAILSWCVLGLGFLWILIDRDGLAWHDRLSKTRLVIVKKSS